MKTYTLFELNEYIRRILALNLPEAIWVSCEIAQLNPSRGHYFLALVEKGAEEGEVLAHSDAVIWHQTYRQLRRKLGFNLDSLLRSGLSVRLKVKPDFHERFGLKLIIEDIDPSYTLGQLELQRQETIQKLKHQGLLEANQQLVLPSVIQHIAVITSEKAAGYQDFLNQLQHNVYGYRFYPKLFPSAMQGQQVAKEMLHQFKKINRQKSKFDCIVIIRGGGSRLDLEAFDRLELCAGAAQSELPIITGIGHDVDQSVLDMVAHTALKTPTAVADYIINRSMLFENHLLDLGLRVQQLGQSLIRANHLELRGLEQRLYFAAKNKVRFERTHLANLDKELPVLTKQLLQANQRKLAELERIKDLLSPEKVLQRGYSLTLKDGQIVKSTQTLTTDDELKIRFADGEVSSKVTKVQTNPKEAPF